jgi:hypothetical protein
VRRSLLLYSTITQVRKKFLAPPLLAAAASLDYAPKNHGSHGSHGYGPCQAAIFWIQSHTVSLTMAVQKRRKSNRFDLIRVIRGAQCGPVLRLDLAAARLSCEGIVSKSKKNVVFP